MPTLDDGQRRKQATALRDNRDREVSPTEEPSRPGGLSYGDITGIETRRSLLRVCIEI